MKVGSLFSGYGGLDLAVESVLGAEPAWFVEFDEAPSKVLEHRFPGVPNFGDVTQADWSTVEPVDVITGGSPCQDLSAAGKRAGMSEGTRSNLWVNMREAIAEIRPRFVVWENVQGALSATATSDSDMEQGGGGLLAAPRGGYLRALGRVLGDLAEVGYDTEWTTIRASDIGAPHHRARVFLLAWQSNTAGAEGGGRHYGQASYYRPADRKVDALTDDCDVVADAEGDAGRFSDGNGEPAAYPEGIGGGAVGHGSVREGAPVAGTVGGGRLLSDAECGGWDRRGLRPDSASQGGPSGDPARRHNRDIEWGKYAPAIRRWERIVGPAPAPTELGKRGNPRLAAPFAEWMMGLPPGWVTDPEIGLSRAAQLKAIGNGVCPQQAAAALTELLARMDASVTY